MAPVHSPRFTGVVLPLAPWVFGSASVALAYLPGLLSSRLHGYEFAYTALATMLAALAGIAVQPIIRRPAFARDQRSIGVAMSLVVAGFLIAALAASTHSPVLITAATITLGSAYGACQVCDPQEIRRIAAPSALAPMTAVCQAVSYVGFALPFVSAAAS